jgi:hypothetical protein
LTCVSLERGHGQASSSLLTFEALAFFCAFSFCCVLLVSERTKAGRNQHPVPLGSAEMRLRGQLIGSHLLGLGVARYIMKMSPLAHASREDLVIRLVPVLNAYLPGSLAASNDKDKKSEGSSKTDR